MLAKYDGRPSRIGLRVGEKRMFLTLRIYKEEVPHVDISTGKVVIRNMCLGLVVIKLEMLDGSTSSCATYRSFV